MTPTTFHSFKILFRSMIVAALLSIGVNAGAQTAQYIDSLYVELAKANTPADSVAILHNLYDCFYFDDRKPILHQIFETAERAKDYSSMLETLFVLTALYQYEPEMEAEIIEMANRVPDSELQRAILLYTKVRYQTTNLNHASETERQQKLHQALKEYRKRGKMDKYTQMAGLFLICTNLRNTTDSELLIHYLQQLHDMVEEFPYEELPVRTLFYSMATNIYIANDMFDKALVSNKRILDIVGQFDKIHESQGRIFRNYDGSLYDCYHKMLVCAQELSEEDIDMYYDRILRIIDKNPRIRHNLDLQNKSRIYYLMAKKRYAEVLPLLKDQLNVNTNQEQNYHFAKLLVKASRELGDKESLLYSSKILNSIYRERLQAKSDVSLSELQTIYDVENLKGQNRDLTFDNQQKEINRRQQDVVFIFITVIILICILIWILSLYIQSKSLIKRLSASNIQLIKERNSLKKMSAKLVDTLDKAKAAERAKSDFVENISDEIREPLDAIVAYSHIIANHAKEDERPYIKKYADIMGINTDLLIRLVNDILDLPLIESGELSIKKTQTSVKALCNFSLELIKKHANPGVDIIFSNSGQPDIKIITDPQRAEQILSQILTNAAKFTKSGLITFGYEINKQGDKISFIVTDTGVGIPAGMEEKIFDRFVKTDPTAQGCGLGLYVGRLLTNMLGGELTLDSTYNTGARFIFTIPIN